MAYIFPIILFQFYNNYELNNYSCSITGHLPDYKMVTAMPVMVLEDDPKKESKTSKY